MADRKYKYNANTCQYEEVIPSVWAALWRFCLILCLSLGAMGVSVHLYYTYYLNYNSRATLEEENKVLRLHYQQIQQEVKDLQSGLDLLQIQDDSIYRVILGTAPVTSTVRQAGIGGRAKATALLEDRVDEYAFVSDALASVRQLKNQLLVQEQSYKQLLGMAHSKEVYHASLPAIQPISNKRLYRLASGFGMRIDPIYKIKKLHTGVDFSAPKGTPIYATGGGIVRKNQVRLSGYGRYVVIDHGNGYETLYAHMTRSIVKENDRVSRGDCIGYVGSTGKSTAPHLHYEVHYNGNAVNPVHFFFQDLTQEEYEKLLQRAAVENQSLE